MNYQKDMNHSCWAEEIFPLVFKTEETDFVKHLCEIQNKTETFLVPLLRGKKVNFFSQNILGIFSLFALIQGVTLAIFEKNIINGKR